MPGRRARPWLRWMAGLAAAALTLLFAGLGVWQVQRLGEKRALIARVDARVHAPPVASPPAEAWPRIGRAQDEYRRLALVGRFQHDKETLVQAVTGLGAGYWVLTPLQDEAGRWVLVNRGFVPPERRDPAQRGAPPPAGHQQVQGLLRLSEPGGGFLRRNAPASGRWHSRDVAAIGAALGLPADRLAPYFVDAEAPAASPPGTWPVPGLTVIRFPNNHLAYAITWFILALMVLAAWAYVWRSDRGARGFGDNDRPSPPRP